MLVAPTSSAGRNLPRLSNTIRFVMGPSGAVVNRILAAFGASGPRTCDVCAAWPRKPGNATYDGVVPETITVPGFARASANCAVAMYERVLALDVLFRYVTPDHTEPIKKAPVRTNAPAASGADRGSAAR